MLFTMAWVLIEGAIYLATHEDLTGRIGGDSGFEWLTVPVVEARVVVRRVEE